MTAAVRAEVLKLLTLPSLALTVALTWAVTLLLDAADPPGSVLVYSQVGFLVLGTLAATHEYQAGGQIRATLLAVPRRPLLAGAKAVALAVTTAPAAVAVAATAGEPGGAGYLVLDTLLAAGVGTVLRSPVGTVGVLLPAYEIVMPLARTRVPDVAGWLPAPHTVASPAWTAAILLVAAMVITRRDA